ncbi:HEAT repeat domain-containing protein [Leptolyngbya sp. FACHB-36]|uniref:HEAT repeat domain-containing protein n=1 Tax=Leptolyngbya sp. FACHB-36 TaxID=2692808 RepID=UPI00168002CB|nr:HEAT repeat domain-containing protein [Leptolyngbya sp. FACHB-36]MBD2019460.1 HEAT repeat domain-containing protein [Leptolyngbya sp. FACHB-36]
MEALIGLLSIVAVAGGLGAAYRVGLKRKVEQKPPAVVVAQPPVPALPAIQPAAKEPPSAPTASSPIAAAPAIASPQPMIPDPWLSDEELAELEAATAPAPVTDPTPEASSAHDPLEPASASEASGSAQETDTIAQLRSTQSVAYLTRYANHSDSAVRVAVAETLGRRAVARETATIVPLLGRLSQDSQIDVRVAAIASLGAVRSPAVLPWLQQAQTHPDGRVSKAAAAALQSLKSIRLVKPTAKRQPPKARPNVQG